MTVANLGAIDSESHIFSTSNPILIDIGLGNFTQNTYKATVKSMKDSGALQEFIDDGHDILGSMSVTKTLKQFFNELGIVTFYYTTHTGSTYRSSAYSVDDLFPLIKEFEDNIRYAGLVRTNGNKTEIKDAHDFLQDKIFPIQNSLNKCLEATFEYPVGSGYGNHYMRLYFQNLSNDFERVPSLNNPIISSQPRSPTGFLYNKKETEASVVGGHIKHHYAYAPNGLVSDEITNLVAAPLRLNYNESLCMWESTQQIVAYLLSDVPGVINPNFDPPDQWGDSNNSVADDSLKKGFLKEKDDLEKFSDPGSEHYYSNYTTGLAVPFSVKNNNPEAFTPNIIKEGLGGSPDDEQYRLEKIIVVNRSTAEFSKGQLVLCTLIGGEWLISEFGKFIKRETPPVTKFWSFQKMMVNSDSLFMLGGELTNVSKYESEYRKAWYNDWLSNGTGANSPTINTFNDVATKNGANATHKFERNTNGVYYAWSSDEEYPGEINIDKVLEDAGEWVMGYELPMFWGPVFTDGYSVGSLVTNDLDTADNGRSIPADTAVAGWGPTFNLKNSQFTETYLNRTDFYQASVDFRNYTGRLPEEGGGARPGNASRVQFSPLSAEAVIHADNWATTARSQDRRSDIKNTITNNPSIYKQYSTTNQFADIIRRNNRIGALKSSCTEMYTNPPGVNTGVAYDCFIEKEPPTKPFGSTRAWSDVGDNGLNFAGVTFAAQRISKRGGGNLIFSLTQAFGLTKFTSVTSSSSSISIIGGWIFGGGGGSVNTYGFPMWGSVSDRYNEFGTTALHCRIFDAWPIEDTLYDPAYFGVLHFNTKSTNDDGVSSVDIRVPTKGDAFAPVGTIHKELQFDATAWNLDKIRRGQLLSGGGFKYKKRTLGLNPEYELIFENGGENLSPVATFEHNNLNKLISFSYNSAANTVTYKIEQETAYKMDGEDMTPSDFEEERQINIGTREKPNLKTYKGYFVYIPPDKADDPDNNLFYDGVWLRFDGIVKDVDRTDNPPKNHTNGEIRLSDSSERGEIRVDSAKETTVELASNSTNEYDVFYFFHNDITHTIHSDQSGSQIPGFLQYVILDVS